MPKRIQRKRERGWRMPEGAIYVGRPTKFGNPHTLTPGADDTMRHLLVVGFEEYARRRLSHNPTWLAPLRGKDLACWCAPSNACHADVLLRLANQ